MLATSPPDAVVYVTEQVPVVLPVPPRAHVPAGVPLNDPDPDVENVTVPAGRTVVPALVSWTDAVQVLPAPALTGVTQLSVVVVLRRSTVRTKVPELDAWAVSPPYDAVIVWVDPPVVGV
jgi:hypothetical protein